MPTLTGGQENKLEKLSFLLHDLFNIAEASFPRPTLSNFGSVALPPSTEYYVSTITLNIFKNSEKMAQRKSFVPILETIVGGESPPETPPQEPVAQSSRNPPPAPSEKVKVKIRL